MRKATKTTIKTKPSVPSYRYYRADVKNGDTHTHTHTHTRTNQRRWQVIRHIFCMYIRDGEKKKWRALPKKKIEKER